jgi:hypothetical protein
METKLLTDESAIKHIIEALAEYDHSGDFWHCIGNIDINVCEWVDEKGRPELRVVAYRVHSVPFLTVMDRWQTLARIPLSSDDDDDSHQKGRLEFWLNPMSS